MKCYDIGILQAYIDGELSPPIMQRVAQHLDICEVCQGQFNELIEMNEWEVELKKQEIQIDTIDVEKAWNELEYKLDNKNRISKIRGVFINMNKMKRFATVAALALIVISVPVGASTIYNLFTSNVLEDKLVNEGMTREDGTVVDATKNGEFQTLDKKITDQNITVHLTDLYVSESRTSVHYRIEDEKGNLIPVEYDTKGLELKSDGIIDGKQVEAPEYYLDKKEGTFSQVQFLQNEKNLPFKLLKDNKELEIGIRDLGDKAEGTITFAGFNPIDYPVTLDININKIGKVSGSWKGQLEIKGNN